jgi:hypothetical protein
MNYEELAEKVRHTLETWEKGHISNGEFHSRIYDLVWDPREFEALEAGETVMAFGSCCCSEHPPDRTFKCEITIQPHGYTIKRCE